MAKYRVKTTDVDGKEWFADYEDEKTALSKIAALVINPVLQTGAKIKKVVLQEQTETDRLSVDFLK